MLNTDMCNKQPQSNGSGTGRPKSDIDQLLDELFSWYTAEDLKEDLSQWYIAASASPELDEWKARERADLAFLHQQLTGFFTELEQAWKNRVA